MGTEDGYGDCNLADETECTIQGKPWAGVCAIPPAEQNKGSGHLWPALAAERGQHDVALGDSTSAAALLLGMSRTGSGVGLIPEQVWENADLPASPFGTQPECASIGFVNGKPAGEGQLARTFPRHGLEPFEVGRDSITPVDPAYKDQGTFEFTGKIDKVEFALTKE